MNVLVVDDERLLRWSLERLFTKHQVGVITVGSGEEALQYLAKNHFDWLVTDLRLPGISGFDVLRFAKDIQPQIQCIVISAFGSQQTRAELKRIGIHLYLDKPFDLDFLLQTILHAKAPAFDEEQKTPKKKTSKLLSLL